MPIIYAAKKIKFKPENPGGLNIANKDKEIYNHISGKKTKTKAIKTLRSSEDPVSKEEAMKLLNKQLKDYKAVAHPKPVKLYMPKKVDVDKILKNSPISILNQNYTIRIAKIKNEDVLDRAWKIMLRKYSGILGKLKPELHTEKQLFKTNYYLHVGTVISNKNAEAICVALKKQGYEKCSIHLKEKL